MDAARYSIGDATMLRVPYVDVLVDAPVVGLTSTQVEAIEWAAPMWAEQARVRVAAAAWIIESHGHRIVVDPLQAADGVLRTGPDAAIHQQAFADALDAAGFPRASIDTVVASHIDGIGMIAWVADEQWSPFFPNAEVLISRREYEAIASDGDYCPDGSEALLALHARGVVTTVDDEHLVTSDVTTTWTGAHSPGHQIVDITSQGAEAKMIGHLALSPLHFAIDSYMLHGDPPSAGTLLAELRDDPCLLVGPLWPTPGAARWIGEQMRPATPDSSV